MASPSSSTFRPHTVTLAVLAVVAVLAAGCFRYEVDTVVQPDGSGQLTIASLLGPEAQALTEDFESDTSGFDDAMPEGAVLSDVEDGDYAGRQAVISFDSLEELNELVIGPLVLDQTDPSDTAVFSAFAVTEQGTVFAFDATTLPFEQETTDDDIEITSQLVVTLDLPGVPLSSNADEVTAEVFTWRIPDGAQSTLTARTQTEIVGGFIDVAGNVHADAIVWVADEGITTGFPDDTFRPSNPVTRGQMATFLTRALDLEPGTATFPDSEGTTHEDAIAAVAAAGITGGFTDGTYRPAEPVTRGQMATFLTRALDLEPGTATFPDSVGTTHEDAIAAVAAAGITGGFTDGTYRPAEPVTRGQMATFLRRALDPEL